MFHNVLIRKAETADIDFIKSIETECGLSPWSADDYSNEISREDSIFLVATTKSEIVGYLLARLITKHNSIEESSYNFVEHSFVELYNIGVKNNHRKRGFGNLLLESLIDMCKSANAEHIILEVRVSNESAVKLYKKYGFREIYERKNLYRNPSENGFGMKLDILKNT